MASIYHTADFQMLFAHIRDLVSEQLAISDPTAVSHVWNSDALKERYIIIDNALFEARKMYMDMHRAMNSSTPF